MKTICLSCLIYTLKDKPVEDNAYLEVFFIWLSKVIEFGGLTGSDQLNIHIDKRTLDYLQAVDTVLGTLILKLPCPYTFIQINPPSNQLEGMMNKYLLTDYDKDVYLYSDIDILIIRPFRIFTDQLKENIVYLCSEGDLTDDNYGVGFPADFSKEGLTGFSAGKFAITSKDKRDQFFSCIQQTCDYSTKFNMVEQPIFNRSLYSMPREYFNTELMSKYVSFNGNSYKKDTTIFYDNAGDVGCGLYKLKKMVGVLCGFTVGEC
jgi:hypothetical protein